MSLQQDESDTNIPVTFSTILVTIWLRIKSGNELAWNPIPLVCKPTKETDQWHSSLVSQPDQLRKCAVSVRLLWLKATFLSSHPKKSDTNDEHKQWISSFQEMLCSKVARLQILSQPSKCLDIRLFWDWFCVRTSTCDFSFKYIQIFGKELSHYGILKKPTRNDWI